ncbi:SAM-dependent methyltransferase [Cryptosporangium minutisporangium]|uniref:SAM-dependent methyltransferase n=1 Tax=Cryptosporangium minutisporangium TaxID=113569 RepID=A0ABP6T1Q0_9ACTN
MRSAGIDDYFLGGAHHVGPDRAAARELAHAIPSAQSDVWAGRAFARRAAAYLSGQGIRQFLDLGSGIPTAGCLHDLAHNLDPAARVAYVDADPTVAELARQRLADVPHTAVLEADLRDVDTVLASAEIADLLDFSHPIGLFVTAVMQFIPDSDHPGGLLAAYTDALSPGSHLVLSHPTRVSLNATQIAVATGVYDATGTPLTLRDPDDLAALFDRHQLLPPSDDAPPAVVPVTDWRPDPLEQTLTTRSVYGAVGVLPRHDDRPATRPAAPPPVTGRAPRRHP